MGIAAAVFLLILFRLISIERELNESVRYITLWHKNNAAGLHYFKKRSATENQYDRWFMLRVF